MTLMKAFDPLQMLTTVFYASYSCDSKAGFSTSLVQSLASHDPSEILLLKKHFLTLS